jgi:hypothetical protein
LIGRKNKGGENRRENRARERLGMQDATVHPWSWYRATSDCSVVVRAILVAIAIVLIAPFLLFFFFLF